MVKNDNNNLTFPASAIQQQFWFLNQLYPKSSAYNIPSVFRIMGDLDAPAIERSLNGMIQRHSIFRTFFKSMNGKLVQVVLPEMYVKMQVCESNGDVEQTIRKEVEKPFDLSNGPLIRACILKQAMHEYFLIIVMHHIVTDLFTKELFGIELSERYKICVSGQGNISEHSILQYSDYSQYCDGWLNGPEFNAMSVYWKTQLQGRDGIIDLPTDYNKLPVQSLRGKAYPFNISKESTRLLKIFSRKNNANIFLTLLTVYSIVLHRYSGQSTITIGVPLTNRRKETFREIMGCFVNILPIIVDFSTDLSFLEVLKQIRLAMLGAHRNQEMPFEKIVDAVQPKRNAYYNPLFQVGFTFEPPMKLQLHDLIVESVYVHSGGSQLDMFPVLWESGGEIRGNIEYSTDLFTEKTIERFTWHFRELLAVIIDGSCQTVSKLPMLTEAEKNLCINEWNNTAKQYPKENGIHCFFENQVRKTPEATALIYKNTSLTYMELNQRANKLAHFLIKNGVLTGMPVGIFMERSLDMVISIYGILKAGGVYVPLDPDYPESRIFYMIDETQFSIILTQKNLMDSIPENKVAVICVDTDWANIGMFSDMNPEKELSPDASAYIIYTSGSTGRPKGVVNSHKGICNRILWMQDELSLNESDAVLQKTPFSFDVSLWEFFWPLLFGAKMVIADPESHKDPTALIHHIKEHGVSILHFVPSMLQAFLENTSTNECTSLKKVISSGEALSVDLQEKFFSVMMAELYNLYGPTEAAVDVTFWKCRRNFNHTTVPIGKPLANTAIYILDNHLQPVPVGIPGEIHIGGVQVAKGYLNRIDLTVEKFIDDPFSDKPGARLYKTGDLARYLPDGNIEYLGRNDFQVKIHGVRIELGEIETVITEHPGVAQACVVTKDYEAGGGRLIAYVVPDGEKANLLKQFLKNKKIISITPLTDTEKNMQEQNDEMLSTGYNFIKPINELLKNTLPDYMIPSIFILLKEFPLTLSGKVDRIALPYPEEVHSQTRNNYVPAQTNTEKKIVTIWSTLLKKKYLGVTDSFFDLGGTSLLSAYLAAELGIAFNHTISVVDIFQYPTIRALARYLEEKKSGTELQHISNRANLRRQAAIKKKLKHR